MASGPQVSFYADEVILRLETASTEMHKRLTPWEAVELAQDLLDCARAAQCEADDRDDG